MAQKPKPPAADEKHIRRLLEKYSCPVPYHEIRTRFLGSIATPVPVQPLQIVKDLWGGELPEFESMDAVNELIGALINELWNSLTRHQKRTDPFRLTRTTTGSSRQELGNLALLRRQELDGFVEGLFNGQDRIDLPEKASSALDTLGEIRAMMAGISEMAKDDGKSVKAGDLDQTFKHVRELTLIIEKEINVVVLDCTRARRQMMKSVGGFTPPTLH
ncbi:hypothetical protein LWV33_14785 [Brucella intermedia]|jgi:hypothetical protein